MSEKFSTKKRIAVTAQGFNTFITEIFLLTRISNHLLWFVTFILQIKEAFVEIWVKCINHVLEANIWASLLSAGAHPIPPPPPLPPFNMGDLQGGDGIF